MVQGLNPGGGGIFRTRSERPWGPPTLLYTGHRVSLGVKRVGCRFEHPTHLAPRLKKEESYICTSPLRLHDLFQGELYLYLYGIIIIIIIIGPNPVACYICCISDMREVFWLASWGLSFWESCNCYTSVWQAAVAPPIIVNHINFHWVSNNTASNCTLDIPLWKCNIIKQ